MNKVVIAGALFALCSAGGAAAQTSVYDLPQKLVDSNGVDLASGRLAFPGG
ncbi:MAG TPA: hypothetical protein VEA60_07935 [Allosphingosinicella sp.]|nr:hypothetical protein [Allosphingosinicella sp.]